MNKVNIIFLIPFLFLTACMPASVSPVDVAENTPSPTLTPTPSPTETPWNIVIPTRTKSPTKTPLAPIAVDLLHPGQHAYTFQPQNGPLLRYWLYLPENFDPETQWPVILFLHGSDERGTTIERVKNQGLPQILETQTDFPFVVISPQLDSGFWSKRVLDMDELLDHLTEILPVNRDQLYLTGISLGGFGVWDYALQYPDRFAAIVPIAGGYTEQAPPDNICTLKDLPIWIFHGDADTQVEPFYSQVLVDALQACGGNPIFTLYPDTSHISTWDKAYADSSLYEWLLSQKK
ncbi:MAG TPA: alpha/beta fold hydrolase [Anaerolineales bacterium]|nr:alpha/beta fold hydrolase [Anaerolineales bacterium]